MLYMIVSLVVPIIIMLGVAPDLEAALYFTVVVLILLGTGGTLLGLVFSSAAPRAPEAVQGAGPPSQEDDRRALAAHVAGHADGCGPTGTDTAPGPVVARWRTLAANARCRRPTLDVTFGPWHGAMRGYVRAAR